uniref:Small ribosomal subunit protein uS4c n=1 Tax=Epipogium roseum TaxID=556037 RepID=A0A0B4N4T0_9ASPA|nr:ribosomal protein S4 [Epipogium roseum]AII40849.1 ribosomal protein S4 [Epipogium roseum]
MSRFLGPRLKKIRRLAVMPGLTKKKYISCDKKKKLIYFQKSQYRIQLEEKQKLRFYYGITEKKLLIYMHIALRSKGSTGLFLLKLLETRLDNIIFKSGIASTIPEARQLVNHGHIRVNGNIVDIPSFQCNPKDIFIKKNYEILTFNKIIHNKFLYFKINELLVVEYYSRHT